jgi:hypothetical protein
MARMVFDFSVLESSDWIAFVVIESLQLRTGVAPLGLEIFYRVCEIRDNEYDSAPKVRKRVAHRVSGG